MNHYPDGHNLGPGMVYDTPEEREIERLTIRLAAAEKQRQEAVWAMQAVQPGVLSPKEEERLQRLRDYAYQLQNRLDNRPARFNMDHTRARLSAVCWAVGKITGQQFQTTDIGVGQP